MPLKGSIPSRIKEFHSGPTYARTAAKFGAARANKQAEAVAFSSKRKDPPMKSKMNEDGMAGEKGMSPRKAMASSLIKGGGNFGVEPYGEAHGGMAHPDATAHTGMDGAMEEGERATPPAIHLTKQHLPAQAAPRHGPHMDNWPRGGKV
jgi:hypothetical protein